MPTTEEPNYDPHPVQQIRTDKNGHLRFRENAIVRYLLDKKTPCDMNELARMPFSREDRVQFAQLIGYSLSGFSELSYVNDLDYRAAELHSQSVEDPERQAMLDEIACLRKQLDDIREILGEERREGE